MVNEVENQTKLKIAIFFGAIPTDGGSFSYERRLEELIESICGGENYELCKFYPKGTRWPAADGEVSPSSVFTYKITIFEKVEIWALRSLPWRTLLGIFGKKVTRIEKRLGRQGVDLVYFASPNLLALGIFNIPIATTVWDLGHRDLPEFPEFSENGKWLNRELYFRETVPKSVFVVTDSEVTRSRLESLYGLGSDRGFPVGLLPRERLCTCLELNELVPSGSFLLYPAQKWKHKNHQVLIGALRVLAEEGLDIKLVLSGADKGEWGQILATARRMGVSDKICDLGFVSDHLLTHLMMSAACVVMPSRLGPTNIPPLEALLMGKPTIVSTAHKFDHLPNDAPIKLADADVPEVWAQSIKAFLKPTYFDPQGLRVTLEVNSSRSLSAALRFAGNRIGREGK